MYRVGVIQGVMKANASAGKQGHRKKRPKVTTPAKKKEKKEKKQMTP